MTPTSTTASLKHLQTELILRLLRGEHVVLYGPLGSGKSVLITEVYRCVAATGAPRAFSTTTSCLEDVTRALERAYPEVRIAPTRRRTRGRLWVAADQKPGVLIFDHVSHVGTAMIGFLRRLRGGVTGVLLAFDIEREPERLRLRDQHLGRPFLPMPLSSSARLHRLLRSHCADRQLPRLVPSDARRIVRAARGRIGWIAHCARLIAHPCYWTGTTLHTAVLFIDTEIALRQIGPKLPPQKTRPSAHWVPTRALEGRRDNVPLSNSEYCVQNTDWPVSSRNLGHLNRCGPEAEL